MISSAVDVPSGAILVVHPSMSLQNSTAMSVLGWPYGMDKTIMKLSSLRPSSPYGWGTWNVAEQAKSLSGSFGQNTA